MAYTPNVPQGNQQIASTQNPILQNFTFLNTTLQADHAFNGNEISSQADGTHQKISLPNQSADITGALPTGIAAVEYCIGGNLYTWNGVKNPISGVSASGIFAMQTSFTTIITLPSDCIGFILIQLSPIYAVCNFTTISGVGGVSYP